MALGLTRGRRVATGGLLLLATIVFALPSSRVSILRSVGHALVASDPIGPVEVIVVANDGGSSGELEAADLVQSGVASRVAVFAHVLLPEDREFIKRGFPFEDSAERSTRQLTWLGVKHVERIPKTAAGTEAEVRAIAAWCQEQGIRSLLVVTSADHSRRFRRLLLRAIDRRSTAVSVKPARYSRFRPDEWWRTRDGVRTCIIELQKLLLDVVRHPLT